MQTIPEPVRAAAIPKTMRAAAIDRFGGPEVLSLHTLPVPDLDANEVLIRLDTAGVGVWDADMRAGWWPDGEPRFPLVLGTDGAGTVAAIGARIRRLRVGDQVYSYSFTNPKGGFYAEYVAVAAEKVAPVPRGLDLQRAELAANPTIPELQATIIMSLAADGLDDLEARAGQLQAIFAPNDYLLPRPTGGQAALYSAMLPGSPTPRVVGDYTQYLLPRDLAGGAPYTGTEVGDRTGMLLFIYR